MKLTSGGGGSTTNGEVAGATGSGPLPTGGADLGAILLQLQKSIEALVQAVSGNAALGGGAPAAPAAPAETGQGGEATGGGETAEQAGKPAQTGTPEQKPEQKELKSYTVKKNDTLSKIARKHGVSVDALYELNKETIGPDRNKIKPGEELKIPEGGKDPVQGGGGDGGRANGNGRGNRGRGNGNGGGDRANPGNGNGNGGSGDGGGGGGTGGSEGAQAAPQPDPAQIERDRIAGLRVKLEEARAERKRYQDMLVVGGSVATVARQNITRLDGVIRDLNSAINRRGN